MRKLIRSESGAARAVKEFQADFATDTVRDASLLLEVKVAAPAKMLSNNAEELGREVVQAQRRRT